MSKPAFIVEGRMEQIIIQKTCPGTPVVLIECNGDNVDATTMGRFIHVKALALKRYNPKVVICDREGRRISEEQFAVALYTDLRQRGVEGDIIIGVADREFENWILAGLSPKHKTEDFEMKSELVAEGSYGKNQLKKGMREARYSETVHGPDLFRRCNPTLMAQQSKSAARFINQIREHCKWARGREADLSSLL